MSHSITGRTVLLSTGDAALYECHLEDVSKRFEPANEEERKLTQSIADSEWRLQRIPALEAGIYAVGRAELASLHVEQLEAQRKHEAEERLARAARRYKHLAQKERLQEFDLADFGFEFTIEQIQNHLPSTDPASWSDLPQKPKPEPKAA